MLHAGDSPLGRSTLEGMTTALTARELHSASTVVDTHNDLILSVTRHEPEKWGTFFREHWLPQLQQGGVNVQVLPVFLWDEHMNEGALRQWLTLLEGIQRLVDENPDTVALCSTGADLDAALGSGRIAMIPALEGCAGFAANVELIPALYRLGIRIASLTHFGRTHFADGSGEDAAGSRLTRAGVAAVIEMERIGMIVDISHLGFGGVMHVLDLATRPVIATHSSVRALRDHHRNLTDEQIKGVAQTGGVIGINFFAGFLTEGRSATVSDIVDHIDHVVTVAGVDHVGLGPDFIKECFDERYPLVEELWVEGIDCKQYVAGLEGPAGLPLVTEELMRRGYSEDDVRKVLGENFVRVFRAELGRPLKD